jgi:hypothetical protein
VKQALDPQGRGRQHLASQLEKLAGTRMAGFVLTRQMPAGKWGATSLPHPHRRRHFSHPVAPCTGSRAVNVCAARHTLFLSPSTAQCLIPVALLPCLVRTASCFTCTD